jgi:hypothetical protein
VLQERRFIERRQGGGQPNALERGGLLEQQIVLEGGQGCPPEPAHAIFIAATRRHTTAELLPEGDEVHRQR